MTSLNVASGDQFKCRQWWPVPDQWLCVSSSSRALYCSTLWPASWTPWLNPSLRTQTSSATSHKFTLSTSSKLCSGRPALPWQPCHTWLQLWSRQLKGSGRLTGGYGMERCSCLVRETEMVLCWYNGVTLVNKKYNICHTFVMTALYATQCYKWLCH